MDGIVSFTTDNHVEGEKQDSFGSPTERESALDVPLKRQSQSALHGFGYIYEGVANGEEGRREVVTLTSSS